ncbi:antibiotic biosynthesis monooxygenase [Propioniciclava sinopodophylli]|jgi:quinol monooxygenase YgiN|uniref:Antibiotic biosynthesis monooxygenase n=1 Tax=Propioniciclava sinopodophylli TaxID=1837344 RepID=A0A4Q9KD60_9ACTN|nr:antibiotic biosynthesis monooxygenase family protein [Propioniciclava sinopodophylli]TBT83774.1 antibiotic biosynthesis monooxygenase [Propioniciclava sinopodophylli]
MLAFSRFRVAPDAEASFVERAEAAVAFFRFRPGNVSADLVRNLDEPDLWAIQTVWENVGSYRRAYNGYEAKMVLVTLMSEAIDEPSAYDRPDAVGDNIPRGE